MDLPCEIVLAILKPLARRDLKSARLVSKDWSHCAAEFLFDVIYNSPSKEDIDVFEAITQHSVLSKCPRHLEYDGAEFLTRYSKDEYAKYFWENILLDSCLYSAAIRGQWSEGQDAEIHAWIQETVLPNKSRYENMESYEDCEVVDDGYRKYQEQASYQQDLQSGQFDKILVRGLQNLVSLASVTLQPHWPFKNNYYPRSLRSGSPLARSWSTFYPDPCGWSFTYDENKRQGPDGARHYLIISSALARARKQIRKFGLGEFLSLTGGVPPYVFDRSDHSSTGLDITSFSGLEHFDITLARYHDYKTPMIFEHVHGLQLLLDSMAQLKFLELKLSCDYEQDLTLYTHRKIFSANKFWSKLTTFKLEFMSTTATDLLLLLVFQMPEMRHLELGGIKLLEGTWHSVIEGLKQSNCLSSFSISYNNVLVHRSGIRFMRYNSQFRQPIRDYIIHGGHHPCIPPNQPKHTAQNYMMEIEPSVRGRLMELDSTRCGELDSAARKASMDARGKWSRGRQELDGSQASWETLIEIESCRLCSDFTL